MAAWQLMMAQEKAILFCWQFVLLFSLPALVMFCHFVWGRTFWPMNGLFLCRSFVNEWVNFLSHKDIFHMPPMPALQLRLPLPPTPLCCTAAANAAVAALPLTLPPLLLSATATFHCCVFKA